MTYKVTLNVGYINLEFRFTDHIKALDFAEKAKKYGLPYTDSTGERYELEVSMTIEKCAEGGNPEMAHIENQEQDSMD